MFKDIISSLPYPPYMPDVTPWDYRIFGPFEEEALGGMTVWTNEEVQEMLNVCACRERIPPLIPSQVQLCRIQTVVKHWSICVEHKRSYVEE
jgi:hypothetical protein